jgi:5'(3')-deoxyribonucleotidase
MYVLAGAYNSLERLSSKYDLLVVTSRQHVIETQTLDWIDRHFPGIFQVGALNACAPSSAGQAISCLRTAGDLLML